MIEYNITQDGRVIRKFVTRICDLCGAKRKCFSTAIFQSRKKRGDDKDYCKKCGYRIRVIEQKVGPESPCWKGGRRLNNNGYYRLYVYENGKKRDIYEHKYVYEQKIGRYLTKIEQVHHIDLDKQNNNIDNLYLCNTQKEHYRIHYQMEVLALSLLGNRIWFNKELGRYTLGKHEIGQTKTLYSTKSIELLSQLRDNNGKIYINIYLGNRKHQRYHRYVMEKFLKRKLLFQEHVHHIDGNTTNNRLDNLVILSRQKHKICHNSLQSCVLDLFKDGKITFNKGEYSLV